MGMRQNIPRLSSSSKVSMRKKPPSVSSGKLSPPFKPFVITSSYRLAVPRPETIMKTPVKSVTAASAPQAERNRTFGRLRSVYSSTQQRREAAAIRT